LRSGSNGNCLMVWTAATRVLIDCGWESTRACRRGLAPVPAGAPGTIDAVVLTHLHGDHISRAALRALRDLEVPVYCHEGCVEELGRAGVPARLRPFGAAPLRLGDLVLTPVPVPHTPGWITHGFAVASPADERRLMIATDLAAWDGLLEHFVDADFVFLEANHDLRLARERPVPNSRYHLSNEQAAWLIAHLLRRSRRPPAGIMLGHISAERNRPELLRACLEARLRAEGLWDPALPLWLAPRRAASVTVTLPPRAAAATASASRKPEQLSLFALPQTCEEAR
jgi:glyoxylase-like metal-dependent hydrolase (beta-lactamase superfamily II)